MQPANHTLYRFLMDGSLPISVSSYCEERARAIILRNTDRKDATLELLSTVPLSEFNKGLDTSKRRPSALPYDWPTRYADRADPKESVSRTKRAVGPDPAKGDDAETLEAAILESMSGNSNIFNK